MPVIQKETIVRRAPAEVFAKLADFERAPTWLTGVESTKVVTPGAVGVGTRFVQKRKTMGKLSDVEVAVTRFEPPSALGLDVKRDGKPAGVVLWETLPDAQGTRVVSRVDFTLPGLMKLMTPMVRNVVAKQTAGDLAALKNALEQRR